MLRIQKRLDSRCFYIVFVFLQNQGDDFLLFFCFVIVSLVKATDRQLKKLKNRFFLCSLSTYTNEEKKFSEQGKKFIEKRNQMKSKFMKLFRIRIIRIGRII